MNQSSCNRWSLQPEPVQLYEASDCASVDKLEWFKPKAKQRTAGENRKQRFRVRVARAAPPNETRLIPLTSITRRPPGRGWALSSALKIDGLTLSLSSQFVCGCSSFSLSGFSLWERLEELPEGFSSAAPLSAVMDGGASAGYIRLSMQSREGFTEASLMESTDQAGQRFNMTEWWSFCSA